MFNKLALAKFSHEIGAMKGSYTFFIKSIACSLCAPITIRSGLHEIGHCAAFAQKLADC